MRPVAARQIATASAAGVHPFSLAPMPPIRSLLVDLENPDDAIADLWTRAERGPAVLVVPMEQTAEAVGYPIPPASERTSTP